MFFGKICGTQVENSSVINLSKKYGWFYTNLHHYKQISKVGSPTVHILDQTVKP